MHFPRVCVSGLWALLWVALPAAGQTVVSTRAGLVHYFEGVVAIGGEPLQAQFGRFPEIAEGSELRTGQGLAEVLLGPGVILRMADESAIKMLSASLADVRLELLAGSAILESQGALPGNSVAIAYQNWQVRVPKQGNFRIDAVPAQLRVYNGEVEVRAGEDAPVMVKAGQTLPLGAVLVPDQTLGAPGDGFNDWAFERSQAIAADNATAAQIVDDPALYPNLIDASGLALAGYTYFPPTLAYPYMSYNMYGPSIYGAWSPYASLYRYGYGFGLGLSGAYGLRYLTPGLPGRVTWPSQVLHIPTGGTYHPSGAFPLTRQGVGAPSMPHLVPAAPHPAVVHGGRH
ncbi:exported hypothetical protein [Candidatus Sulfopaludibacter sp. SbA3]|nr:exported hypothetical protein [Candidatus Sulfopaludibacter sp. SbA3]